MLGADYVRSKIGNPGAGLLGRYVGPLVGLYAVDVTTKHINTLELNQTAKESLDNNMRIANQAVHLNDKQRSKMTIESLKDYNKTMNQPVMGSVEEHTHWDNSQESKKRVFDQKWIGKS